MNFALHIARLHTCMPWVQMRDIKVLHLLTKYVNCSMVCIEIGRRYIRRHLLRLLLRLRKTCPVATARSKSRPDDGPVVMKFGDWDDNDPTSGERYTSEILKGPSTSSLAELELHLCL
ncbi:RPM1-interacting protein 4-like protein isoform X2 [Tanacetum coccineum]